MALYSDTIWKQRMKILWAGHFNSTLHLSMTAEEHYQRNMQSGIETSIF